VRDSDGALQDADTLGVLVEDAVDVLRLPERVLRAQLAPIIMKHDIDELHTFLNHTSKEASRIGMKGTGFWPGRWQIARK
jgi:hypothetical protein